MTTQMKRRSIRWTTGLRIGIMVLVALIFLMPIVFMIVSSLKPSEQLLRDSASFRAFLPVGELSLSNYIDAFARAPIGRFIGNSAVVTVLTVVLGLIINSLIAFALVFLRWRGAAVVLSIIIATFILPFEVIAVPLLMVVSRLPSIGAEGLTFGWLNSYHVQILPFVAEAFSIFLFVQYFRGLPGELIEAARMDGASWLQVYTRVIMPISGPVIATVAILRFLYMWNQYLWPLMVVQSEPLRPVMVGLGYFFQFQEIIWGEVMAYLSIITIPVLLFFLALQRAFIESIASTGIKG